MRAPNANLHSSSEITLTISATHRGEFASYTSSLLQREEPAELFDTARGEDKIPSARPHTLAGTRARRPRVLPLLRNLNRPYIYTHSRVIAAAEAALACGMLGARVSLRAASPLMDPRGVGRFLGRACAESVGTRNRELIAGFGRAECVICLIDLYRELKNNRPVISIF